jgi:RND family efflux transporter MFP subunit
MRAFLALLIFALAYAQEIRVSTIVQGRVERLFVKEGQRVKKGDMLVMIDPTLYSTQRESLLAQLKAQGVVLEKVEKDFRRYEELWNRGLLSRSEYEDWKGKYEKELRNYESLKAQLERVERLIEYCQVKAPTSGVIKRIYVREGSFVNGTLTAETLLTIEER